MKKRYVLFSLIITFSLLNCESEIRDITGTTNPEPTSEVIPIDINTNGFDFLEKMQGHWVGTNRVIADDYDWFAWDYRAISSSHIHGIHEGGTLGNLLTSFFVTDYKGKRTIMARNGGLLSGIYRSSYFVLDKVEDMSSEGKYYRFVDAIGSKDIMYFELRFKSDSLYFNAYTSGLGNRIPNRHMTFKGKKMHIELAQEAATATSFPTNEVAFDFTNGFMTDHLYVAQTGDTPKSATFLAQQNANDVYSLAPQSGDPFIITDHPRLGTLLVNITRNTQIIDTRLFVYLSRDPLTDSAGFFTSNLDAYDTLLHFPSLENNEDSFLFTYLHPGTYYLTVISDKNNDSTFGAGDISSISKQVVIAPLENKTENVTNVDVQN